MSKNYTNPCEHSEEILGHITNILQIQLHELSLNITCAKLFKDTPFKDFVYICLNINVKDV